MWYYGVHEPCLHARIYIVALGVLKLVAVLIFTASCSKINQCPQCIHIVLCLNYCGISLISILIHLRLLFVAETLEE